MRQLLALLLALTLLAGASASLADGLIDLTHVRENSEYFTLDVNADADVAFVEARLSNRDRAFDHPRAIPDDPSHTWFDILLGDYGKSTVYAIPRLWIAYCAEEYLNVASVTITVDGVDYTFTDVASEDRRGALETGGVGENLVICFGMENLTFLMALEEKVNAIGEYEDLLATPTRMVLHGAEDVEVELPGCFLLDFFMVMKGAFVQINGFSTLGRVGGTPMTVSPLPETAAP